MARPKNTSGSRGSKPPVEGVAKERTRSRVYVDNTPRVDDPQAAALAKNLNRLMLERGWRQRDVVTKAQPFLPPKRKFERHLISSWLSGRHMPDRINMDILAKVFGKPVSELVPEGAATVVGQGEKAVQMSISTNGTARLKLDMELPAEVALQIMALAQKTQKDGKPL
jgi:transcriptional regulator with XRE-family HTH domain